MTKEKDFEAALAALMTLVFGCFVALVAIGYTAIAGVMVVLSDPLFVWGFWVAVYSVGVWVVLRFFKWRDGK